MLEIDHTNNGREGKPPVRSRGSVYSAIKALREAEDEAEQYLTDAALYYCKRYYRAASFFLNLT